MSIDADDAVDVEEWAKDLTYREVHLFTEGFWAGFTKRPFPIDRNKKLQGKVVADSWYAKGGFVIGRLLWVLLIGGGLSQLA